MAGSPLQFEEGIEKTVDWYLIKLDGKNYLGRLSSITKKCIHNGNIGKPADYNSCKIRLLLQARPYACLSIEKIIGTVLPIEVCPSRTVLDMVLFWLRTDQYRRLYDSPSPNYRFTLIDASKLPSIWLTFLLSIGCLCETRHHRATLASRRRLRNWHPYDR